MTIHAATRRELLGGAGVLFAWLFLPRIARAEGRDPRMLTIVLRGALDGLAAVASVGDPDWVTLRGDKALLMVQKLALAVAKGQAALDKNSVATAKALAKTKISLPDVSDPETKSIDVSLIAVGIYPQFYQFSMCEIEVKMAITMAISTEFDLDVSVEAGWGPFSASVNASYSQKYSYSVEGSSRLYMKLNPVPPPTILQNYMDAVTKAMLAKGDNKKVGDANPTTTALPPP